MDPDHPSIIVHGGGPFQRIASRRAPDFPVAPHETPTRSGKSRRRSQGSPPYRARILLSADASGGGVSNGYRRFRELGSALDGTGQARESGRGPSHVGHSPTDRAGSPAGRSRRGAIRFQRN